MPYDPSYASAISSIESGGKYDILGPTTKSGDRAYGKYQVMGANIPSWTKQILGQEMTPDQFLADPQAQDAVFQGKFGQYVDKYGNPQDAASAWFTGQPLAKGANSSDVLGTTGSQYVDRFNAALGNQAPALPPPTDVASMSVAPPQGGPSFNQPPAATPTPNMPAYGWSPQQGGASPQMQAMMQTPQAPQMQFAPMGQAPPRPVDRTRIQQVLSQMPAPIRGFTFS